MDNTADVVRVVNKLRRNLSNKLDDVSSKLDVLLKMQKQLEIAERLISEHELTISYEILKRRAGV